MRYLSVYWKLLLRLLVILLIYTLARFLFLIFNWSYYHQLPAGEIVMSFIYGLRFDISAVLYINLLFIYLSLLPFKFIFNAIYQRALKIFFLVTNLIFLLFEVADFQYIKFSGKHIDMGIFGFWGDLVSQGFQMSLDYWYLTIILTVLGIIIWYMYPDKITKKGRLNIAFTIIGFVLLHGILLVGVRGNAKSKPIMPIVAFAESPRTGNLILNTPFCMIQTIGKTTLRPDHYFDKQELDRILPQQFMSKAEHLPHRNVVIFILESFSSEFIGYLDSTTHFTPFLDSLANVGVAFRNCYANGRISQQAVPSILAGLPNLMEESILTSPYQVDQFFSMPQYLKKYGYHAYFFHGGNNGTMGFDRFTEKIGFRYFGRNEYPYKGDFDGNWGIYDEPYLKYCAGMLDSLKGPFIASIFTLSSHQPYKIPEKYRERFSKGKYPIQNSISYADYAISRFFEKAKKMDWYKNTLFIFTADHSFPPPDNRWWGILDQYHIPLILFYPGHKFETDDRMVVQHADILPTVADFLGVYPPHLPRFGFSVLSPDSTADAVFYHNKSFYLVKNDYYLRLLNGEFSFFNKKDQPLKKDFTDSLAINRLKAYKQYFENSMVDNTFMK